MSFFSSILSFAAPLVKGFMDKDATEDANHANQMFAREVNQNKIQWTVEDAKKAGIHPLAALGSPVAGSWAQSTAEPASLGDAVGGGLAAAARGPADALAIENAQLQNESLRADIELTRARSRSLIEQARRGAQSLNTGDITTDPRSRILGADQKWPDQQTYESRYGELADWIFGPSILIADANKAYPPHKVGGPGKYGYELRRYMQRRTRNSHRDSTWIGVP